ncbi:C13 family peptidase, partial [Klebsiella pneumoniae]|uniref:C13 family peptidase n=1 Tax=Klebsiella pneumoniae TaxID=573 RepID=UPI003A805BC0
MTKETLHKQYHLVKSHTNTSHVMQYGNKSISTMKVMQFQGMKHRASSPISLPPVTHLDLTPPPPPLARAVPCTGGHKVCVATGAGGGGLAD